MSKATTTKPERPPTEVAEVAQRRRFSASYKRRILREADQCTEHGQLGALLRREGLYSSHLNTWRKQAEQGLLAALSPAKRGPRPKPQDPRDQQIAQLQREMLLLRARAERAEALVEVQKKLSELLGWPLTMEES